MSEHFKWGKHGATLRSVFLGVGSVLAVVAAVVFFYPKVLRRPPAPPVPVLAIAPPASPPVAQEQTSAAPQEEEPAAPESPPAAESGQAFASASPPPANPEGDTAALPQPHPAHPVRRVKRLLAHNVRPKPATAPAPAPEDTGSELPVTNVEPPPDPEPPLPPLGIVIGVRRAQAGLVSKSVSLADLNLATQDGACMAMKRIRKAAEAVCPVEDGFGLSGFSARGKCVQDAISSTLDNMHRAKFDLPKKGC